MKSQVTFSQSERANRNTQTEPAECLKIQGGVVVGIIWPLCWNMVKGGFFQKVWFVFQISKSSKKYSKKTILNLKFKFPANNTLLLMAGNLNFKFRIVFGIYFFGDLKNTSHFLKKSYL